LPGHCPPVDYSSHPLHVHCAQVYKSIASDPTWEGYLFTWVGIDGGQLAVFVAFHGGSGCENLVYLFILKHL